MAHPSVICNGFRIIPEQAESHAEDPGLPTVILCGMRQIHDFSTDWLFSRDESGQDPIPFMASMPDFADDAWQSVAVPHDWSVRGDFDPDALGWK